MVCAGVMPLPQIGEAPDTLDFTVRLSMIEVYLEHVRDLINPAKQNLQVSCSAGGAGGGRS